MGRKIEVDCPECGEPVQVEVSYDSHYGADADGNRGWGMYEVEEVTLFCECDPVPSLLDACGDLAIDAYDDDYARAMDHYDDIRGERGDWFEYERYMEQEDYGD